MASFNPFQIISHEQFPPHSKRLGDWGCPGLADCVPATRVQAQSAKKKELEVRTTLNISPKITQNNFPNHTRNKISLA
jgi:hypothetical protein